MLLVLRLVPHFPRMLQTHLNFLLLLRQACLNLARSRCGNPRPSRFLSTGRCRHTCLLTISWGKAVQLYSNSRCSTLLVYVYTQMV